jgi:hypothetical protein
MGQLIAGTCYVKVDGEMLLLKGSMTATVSEVTREEVVANGRVQGFKETCVPPSISGNFVVDSNFPISKLQTGTDMTVTAEFANGKVFTLGDAFVRDQVEVSADDSEATIKFVGMDGVWK